MQSMWQILILIFIQLQKTLVLQMQLLDRYGLATHTRLFASQPIQWRSYKAKPQGRPDDFPVWLRQGLKITYCWGIMVNRTAVTPSKTSKVPVTLVNTNSYHVWIKQQLLAADIVEVDHCPWDYHSTMSRDGGEVQVLFRPVPTLDVQAWSTFCWR